LSIEEQVIGWFAGLANIAFGFLLGSIITGWFTWKVVVPKVMKNKDIQELKTLLTEGKAYLKEILENQKNHQNR
jgi:hypothetical protein